MLDFFFVKIGVLYALTIQIVGLISILAYSLIFLSMQLHLEMYSSFGGLVHLVERNKCIFRKKSNQISGLLSGIEKSISKSLILTYSMSNVISFFQHGILRWPRFGIEFLVLLGMFLSGKFLNMLIDLRLIGLPLT